MEYYFQQPNTKFDWTDFKKKALSKKGAAELRRKMIIRNIHSSTKTDFLQLKQVCLHMNAIIRAQAIKIEAYQDLLGFFNDLRMYLQDYFIYVRVKQKLFESKIEICFALYCLVVENVQKYKDNNNNRCEGP